VSEPGYGKGYGAAFTEFCKLLSKLDQVIKAGVNVVGTCHAKITKFEQPDEMGAYDRWEMKLQNSNNSNSSQAVKEWADMVLFANYKTFAVKTDAGARKAQGGKRVMYATHHPCWDAKNRFGLKDPLPLEYDSISECVPDMMQQQRTVDHEPVAEPVEEKNSGKTVANQQPVVEAPAEKTRKYPKRLEALEDLMDQYNITDAELRKAIAVKQYLPPECKVEDYPQDFVSWLVSVWDSFVPFVNEQIKGIPF
jgi:hypothetical protein